MEFPFTKVIFEHIILNPVYATCIRSSNIKI